MVFEDPSRKRWRITIASFTSVVLAGLAIFGLSAAALMTNPPLSNNLGDKSSGTLDAVPADEIAKQTEPENQDKNRWQHVGEKHNPSNLALDSKTVFSGLKPKNGPLVTAFLLQEDAASRAAFETQAAKLDAVFPDWYYVEQANCEIRQSIKPEVTSRIKEQKVALVPRLTNSDGTNVKAGEMDKIMQDPKLSSCVAQKLAQSVAANGAAGLDVDIETLTAKQDNAYLSFLSNLKRELHAKNKFLIVNVPSGNTAYDMTFIPQIADAVMIVMHGQHYSGGKPGPLASQTWYDQTLGHFLETVPPNKLIVGLGSYGLDWKMGTQDMAQGVTYRELMALAGEAKTLPVFDPTTRNMVFGYSADGTKHGVWFLDAASFWNEWTRAKNNNVLGVGIWRLGSEDPNIWQVLDPQTDAKKLQEAPPLSIVQNVGKPEVYKPGNKPQSGKLQLTTDAQGFITGGSYQKLPTGYQLDRVGQPIAAKTAVLTFDDGPDPVWTPKIIDYLTQNKLPATFFILGKQAEKYPDIVARLKENGFLVGNHTYSHTDVDQLTSDNLRTELNSTQRIIENTYDSHTVLFRAPYNGYNLPTTLQQIDPYVTAAGLGYITVGANIDSKDWTEPGVDKIVANVISGLEAEKGGIVAFHDGGGDRTQTFAALQALVPELKARGYTIVPLDQALDLKITDLLPNVNGNEAIFVAANGASAFLRNMFWPAIFWIFAFTTAFSIFRILFMSIFATRSVRHRAPSMINPGLFNVSVLIPAYNEEKTIAKTLSTLQQSTHTKFEALVIDDGSTDDTSAVVREFAAHDPRIRLVRKENGGKSTALNLGMLKAKNDIVVTIDADTVLQPQTLNELIKPFADPRVDAVCGNVEVGNVHNLLTGFQALEYITAQNFDRRAFEEVNAISVVPGATGAWRRQRVLDIGGYESDTLTEDADLTIKLLKFGGKIVYAPNARSLTEAPENMRDLAKQRFRWAFGTFQCLGKHADQFFKGTVGWVAMPNIFVFQILFPLLAPIGDIAMLISLWNHDFGTIFWGYIAFTALDVIGSVFAFSLEKKPKRLLLLVLIQRFFYRQFLYITIIRAIIAMLRGQRYGWNKLQRTGTVLTEAT